MHDVLFGKLSSSVRVIDVEDPLHWLEAAKVSCGTLTHVARAGAHAHGSMRRAVAKLFVAI